MARQPPDTADDPPQDESLPNDRATLDDTLANDPKKPRPVAPKQDAAQPDDEDKTQVEIDRIEAYLRGPTAFSA
jgi:hypothetical protein